MKGECRNKVLNYAKFIGDGVLEDYAIIDLGPYPAAVKKKGYRVFGEVYEVEDALRGLLDQIEGEGYLYKYEEVTVQVNNENMQVGFYEYLLAKGDEEFMEPNKKWRSKY